MARRADELHPQLQEIQERQEAQYGPEGEALTAEGAREGLESRLSGMLKYIDDEVGDVQDFDIEGPEGPIPVRSFRPETEGPHPIVVFYHGGGYVMGSVDSHANICHALADRGDALVLSVDYRLAPEHPFPAAIEDGYAALEWAATYGGQLGGDTDRIAVAGDSAGGNLSVAVSLMARDRDGPEIARQLLIYPWLDPASRYELDSYVENADDDGDGSGNWLYEGYVGDEANRANAYFAPLIARDLADLPPATILVAGYDTLRDEGFEFADRLENAGVEANLVNFEAMNHGFVSLLGLVDPADDAVDRMVGDLEETF